MIIFTTNSYEKYYFLKFAPVLTLAGLNSPPNQNLCNKYIFLRRHLILVNIRGRKKAERTETHRISILHYY